MPLELEDLSAELVKPPEGVRVIHLGEGAVHVSIDGLSLVESMILLVTTMQTIEESMDEDEVTMWEEWLEDDD